MKYITKPSGFIGFNHVPTIMITSQFSKNNFEFLNKGQTFNFKYQIYVKSKIVFRGSGTQSPIISILHTLIQIDVKSSKIFVTNNIHVK